jgi:hypothetical protein
MGFPEIVFGRCQRCGGNGADQSSGLGSADAAARDTAGNGLELEQYDGHFYCPVCINIIKADAESLLERQKHAEAEKFRGKAGFTNTVS